MQFSKSLLSATERFTTTLSLDTLSTALLSLLVIFTTGRLYVHPSTHTVLICKEETWTFPFWSLEHLGHAGTWPVTRGVLWSARRTKSPTDTYLTSFCHFFRMSAYRKMLPCPSLPEMDCQSLCVTPFLFLLLRSAGPKTPGGIYFRKTGVTDCYGLDLSSQPVCYTLGNFL